MSWISRRHRAMYNIICSLGHAGEPGRSCSVEPLPRRSTSTYLSICNDSATSITPSSSSSTVGDAFTSAYVVPLIAVSPHGSTSMIPPHTPKNRPITSAASCSASAFRLLASTNSHSTISSMSSSLSSRFNVHWEVSSRLSQEALTSILTP